MSEPTQDWIVANFTHGGRVKFCTSCRAVPAVALGPVHACHGMSGIEASLGGLGGEWAEESVDLARLSVVESDDRPGDYIGFYAVAEGSAVSGPVGVSREEP